jgi:acyl homoserine lactone synthase
VQIRPSFANLSSNKNNGGRKMFKVLSADNLPECPELFQSMHRLRHKVFVEELKWPLGAIRSVRGMEYDQFDIQTAHYIVRINDNSEVDACTRLLPTDGPYLLGDVFEDLVKTIPRPNSPVIWETTRFCADKASAPKNIVGLLVAAMLEFGLSRGIRNYVSVSDIRIEPLLKRYGWYPQRIGEPRSTGTDTAVGEIFQVSQAALDEVRRKTGISGPLLEDSSIPLNPDLFNQEQRTIQVE